MPKFTSDSLKRLIAFVVTALIIAFNKKLGLGMEATEIGALATLATGYIVQSGLKSAAEIKNAGVLAAAEVQTASDADAVLKGPQP